VSLEEYFYSDVSLQSHDSFIENVFILLGELGFGCFGRVFKVLRESDGAVVAGKTCKDLSKLAEEAEALRMHAHPHILRYEGMYEDPEYPGDNMLLTELCAGGSLQGTVDSHRFGMDARQVLRVVSQVAGALDHLHSRGYFHSDVKPQNIFIRSRLPIDVVLGDCADIHPIKGYDGPLFGTMQYHSPEIWQRKGHTGAADDVWALGVSLLAMCGQLPRVEFADLKDKDDNNQNRRRRQKPLLAKYPQRVIRHVQALQELNWGHGIVQLAARMLAKEAKDRAIAGEICGLATELLREYEARGEAGESLGMQSPVGFEPVSFW
jgi:serine/threonine protein kinase